MSSDSRSRRRGVWSHWVPLAITVTVATVGIAAWAWSQRQGEDEEEEEEEESPPPGLDYANADYGDNPPYGATDRKLDSRAASATYGVTDPHVEAQLNAGWGNTMSGALGRAASPHQLLTNAGKAVTAGVGAVGAAMGSALAAIREEDKNAYADHETWSEEAENRGAKDNKSTRSSEAGGKRRKTVAVVVSADTNIGDLDEDGFHEHASILSHIPRNTDFSKIKLFVLIYSPGLKDSALDVPASNLPPASLSSSFSNISHNQVPAPGDELKSPLLKSNADPTFNAVYSQALTLVEKESMILPFTTENGHVHILHHLQPEVIYLQESLSGENGAYITRLQSWLRYDVILVVGADGGHGGLADSESEAERAERVEKWWQREDRVGRGRGVVVVDSLRVSDDWARRVQGKE